MNFKHGRLLFLATLINLCYGVFLFACSILEFTGTIYPNAHNITETIGVHVSYLVFIGSILILLSGIFSAVYRNNLKLINTRIFIGILSLAWPLFLTISLFFTQLNIKIRLVLSNPVALFYTVAILVVKISNIELSKTAKFDPASIIGRSKRKQNVNIRNGINQLIKNQSDIIKQHNNTSKTANSLDKFNFLSLSGKKDRAGFKPILNSFGRRKTKNVLGRIFYSGGRRRTNSFNLKRRR